MQKNKFKVKVEWQGRKAIDLPSVLQYITVAKFDEDWIENAWSVVLSFDNPPCNQGNPSIGFVDFLMPNAPQEKLIAGLTFELYEGRDLTAKVLIVK